MGLSEFENAENEVKEGFKVKSNSKELKSLLKKIQK